MKFQGASAAEERALAVCEKGMAKESSPTVLGTAADRLAEVAQEESAGTGPPDVPVQASCAVATFAEGAVASVLAAAPVLGHTSCSPAARSTSVALAVAGGRATG